MSDETRALIVDTADRIFRDHCTKDTVDAAEEGVWPEALWTALEESGLTRAGIPEECGGSGGTIGDALAVFRLAGRYAAPIPVVETYLAASVFAAAGQAVPEGPLTVAFADDKPFAWSDRIQHVVRVCPNGSFKQVSPSRANLKPSTSIAGEPRAAFDTPDPAGDTLPVRALDAEMLFARGALCRAMQMAGALETIVELTIEHASVRVQFGRPIGSFQAIRQQLAVLAGQVAAASMAAEVAARASETGNGMTEIAVAKARVGEAAGIAAAIAHQVHGAMGITHEHALHHYTRRLWTWRDDYGSEHQWQERLGNLIAAKGADSLWGFVTGS